MRVLLLALCLMLTGVAKGQSQWAAFGPQGKLIYGHFKTGDRIPDYSFAGYRAGGVALPQVATKLTVTASGKDDTAAIQQALDAVAKMPLVDGHRGAVALAAGTFHCSGTLRLGVSGVVLRGDPQGSTIVMTGDPHLALDLGGKVMQTDEGAATTISDPYVPAGTNTFHVADAAGLHAGDLVEIRKAVTPEWLHLMGMDALGDRDGKAEHWIDGELKVRRKVAAVAGNAVTLEVPLMDDYDAKYIGASKVTRVSVTGAVSEVGVEDLKVVAPKRAVALGKDAEFDGIRMHDAADCWMRGVAFEETTNSVHVEGETERVTVQRCSVVQHVPVTTPAKPFDFSCLGTQILFDRCTGSGDSVFYFATQARGQGPVVLLHSKFTGDGHIQPHQRWFTGLLVDGCEVPGGGIDLMNRGQMGSGHGWTIGWSVVWNSSAQSLNIQQPPGAMNWSIGNKGQPLNTPMKTFDKSKTVPLKPGIVESVGTPVLPASLYLEQLRARLGADAVKAVGD